jgi:hypothetical protein
MLENAKRPGLRTHATKIDTARIPDIFTYTTTGQKNFFSGMVTEKEKQPQDVGLKDSFKCRLRIATGRNEVAKKSTTKVNIAFVLFDMDLLEYPHDGETVRKLNRTIQQETKMVDFVEAKHKLLEEVIVKNKELEEKQVIMDKMAKLKYNIIITLSTPIGNFKKIVDVTDNTILFVFAFKEITTKYGEQKIIACSEQASFTETTELGVYWANTDIIKYVEGKKQYWKQIEPNVFGSLAGIYLFRFKKVGCYYNTSRNKCAHIQIIEGRGNLHEETKITQIEDISVSAKECYKFDTLVKEKKLNIGDTITITRIRRLVKSVIIRFMYKDEKINAIANGWIKKLLEEHKEHNKDGMPYLVCVIGPEKYTQNKIYEYSVLTKLPVHKTTK